ncbi:MAG: SH3 domain-containing protein [Leptospirales bacterium]|nr:SH3 domain-containing protein [Leptospirales bacterium]
MHSRQALLAIIFAVIACKAESAPRELEVTAQSGLRLRAQPSLSAPAVALAPSGSHLQWLEDGSERVVIDGIDGRWQKVRWQNGPRLIDGWAFSGYLKAIDGLTASSRQPSSSNDRVIAPGGDFYYILSRSSAQPVSGEACAEGYSGGDCVLQVYRKNGSLAAKVEAVGPFGWFDRRRIWIHSYIGDCGGGSIGWELLDAASGSRERVYSHSNTEPCGDDELTGEEHRVCLRDACLDISVSQKPVQTEIKIQGTPVVRDAGEGRLEIQAPLDAAHLPARLPDRLLIVLNGRSHSFVYENGSLRAVP